MLNYAEFNFIADFIFWAMALILRIVVPIAAKEMMKMITSTLPRAMKQSNIQMKLVVQIQPEVKLRIIGREESELMMMKTMKVVKMTRY